MVWKTTLLTHDKTEKHSRNVEINERKYSYDRMNML